MPSYACPECGQVSDQRHCPEHRVERKPYGSHFDANRLRVLERDPICTVCSTRRSTTAHHHPFTRKRLIKMGVKDPDGLEWLVGVCNPCHGRVSGGGR
jgi:hypothetical protein